MSEILLEACVESLDEAIQASNSGAHRIEYCADLETGGLTPNIKEIDDVLVSINIPVMVMIRPRGGDFDYTAAEYQSMKDSISLFKSREILGFVFGITRGDTLHYERIQELTEFCQPLEVCIHKAIDYVKDPVSEVKKLITIDGITRILSSGGCDTALNGQKILREMILASEQKITIMPAGKITSTNLKDVHDLIKAKTYHGRKIVAAH